MPRPPRIPDKVVQQSIEKFGVDETQRRLGYERRSFLRRRRRIEKKYNRAIVPPYEGAGSGVPFVYRPHSGIIQKEVRDGIVIVGGDNHYEPGYIPTMHRALVLLCKELKPKGVILNGDICDLAALSHFDMIGWEDRAAVADELEYAQMMLHEIEKAAFKAWKAWPIGNHDQRYNTFIAKRAKELENLPFTKMRDYFDLWEPCWRVDINGNVISKHRGRSRGEHDAYNCAKKWGCTAIVGDSHRPYVRAITTNNGTHYAVNHGCIADTTQNCFVNYTEADPGKDWRSAFAVLTFKGGRLLQPELVNKWDDDHVDFRGEVFRV